MSNLFEHRNIFLFSLLFGLVVGLFVNLHILSKPAFARIVVAKAIELSPHSSDENADAYSQYWRGTVDQKLDSIDQRVKEMGDKLEILDCNLTESKVAAAKEGGFYGAVASLIVLLASMVGRNILKVNKKNNS